MKRFEEKVFLGFGTASGMGKATAQLFAKDGAKVVIADLQNSQGEKVVQEIIAEGGIQLVFYTERAERLTGRVGELAVEHDRD